jgi:hypothetical protein
LFGFVAERLTFLRVVDAVEADTFSMVTVQDFNGVAVMDEGGGSGVFAVAPKSS